MRARSIKQACNERCPTSLRYYSVRACCNGRIQLKFAVVILGRPLLQSGNHRRGEDGAPNASCRGWATSRKFRSPVKVPR
jgi:hypothetical protein